MLRRKTLASAALKKEPSGSKPPQVAESSLLEQEKAALDFEISIFGFFSTSTVKTLTTILFYTCDPSFVSGCALGDMDAI